MACSLAHEGRGGIRPGVRYLGHYPGAVLVHRPGQPGVGLDELISPQAGGAGVVGETLVHRTDLNGYEAHALLWPGPRSSRSSAG